MTKQRTKATHQHTERGFEFGAATVESLRQDSNGTVVLRLDTPRRTVWMRVTPTGLVTIHPPYHKSPPPRPKHKRKKKAKKASERLRT